MRNAPSLTFVVMTTSLLCACATVPSVENRLQSMQLYSNMYVIQAGETMDSIAYRYQLTTSELEALNPGLSSSFAVGMRINVRPGTVLSNDIRARAKSSYAAVQQPRLVTGGQSRQVKPQQQIAAANPVIVTPAPLAHVPRQSAPVQPLVESVVVEQEPPVITEIPATYSSENTVVVADTNFKEEVIPDTLDYEPVDNNRAAMNTELQQYVGEWAWPTEGQVAREFAPHEAGGQGVDIAGLPGQDIRAAMAGTVVYSGRDLSGGGNLIIVRHNDELMTTYSHADQLFVAEDDQVAAGDPIASLGWNADKESVLRFEVRENGNPLDPMNFLPLQ